MLRLTVGDMHPIESDLYVGVASWGTSNYPVAAVLPVDAGKASVLAKSPGRAQVTTYYRVENQVVAVETLLVEVVEAPAAPAESAPVVVGSWWPAGLPRSETPEPDADAGPA